MWLFMIHPLFSTVDEMGVETNTQRPTCCVPLFFPYSFVGVYVLYSFTLTCFLSMLRCHPYTPLLTTHPHHMHCLLIFLHSPTLVVAHPYESCLRSHESFFLFDRFSGTFGSPLSVYNTARVPTPLRISSDNSKITPPLVIPLPHAKPPYKIPNRYVQTGYEPGLTPLPIDIITSICPQPVASYLPF